ncbi:cyanophycin synthetase [Halothiobacillus diazotrophicus]|uniref:Cyanophycin synthetase n=1 Tax=Halothiobacillus diazotrophicus TaxID=1860122 RepID=A0A191ZFN5_9GAMM|nr:cyanophycin synthetase [Halothiobacillus diazotrophicus]ANJ66694.1 cyanophycin synthetase [Halothiobacillus diazotrophicus]
MEITRVRALRGPNLWSRHTSLQASVSCLPGECDINELPEFEMRLRARFPQVGNLQAIGQQQSISLAQVLEHSCLALQAQAGCPVTFSRTVPSREKGLFQVVVEYTEEAVGRLALELAESLISASLHNTDFDLSSALADLQSLDEDERLGPSTGAIVQAAIARGIPYRRLTRGSLVQLGWGRKQHRIQAAEIDRTSAIGESIAQDKQLTKALLRAAGIPVPAGRVVSSAADAWSAAQDIGLPVVVKPRDGNQGRGVAVNITTEDQLYRAYASAREESRDVMVERFMPGYDFRVLVVGNQVVAAARRDPPMVIGDGVQSVRQLVDQVNADPRRGDGHANALTRIRLDDIAIVTLEAQGYHLDFVPEKGMPVILRNNGNLSTGGSATDVTDDLHPDLAARAVDAARMVGLDVCGVDLVCENVNQSLEDQHGGIVELNAAPGLRMHLQPSYGKPRAVGEAIIAELYPAGEDGRIPIVAVTGTNGKTTTTRLIGHLLAKAGQRVGITTTDGVYIDGERIDADDCAGPISARNVLLHPHVDAAVFETARGGILRQGLAFDRCDVAVVTNIGLGDHLGMADIHSVEDLAVVKQVVVDNVSPQGMAVLNAADPIVARMGNTCPSAVTFFARDKLLPLLVSRRERGDRVIYVDGAQIVAEQGAFQWRISMADIPLTFGGRIDFQVENVMAAIGAAWGLNLDWSIIARGLAGFSSDATMAPGRFNLFEYRGATVIADYGHNSDAIQALCQAVQSLPARQRLVVISGAGDRRDEDIRQQTRILGDVFDQVLLYQDACQRGRADGEVIGLLREGLSGAQRTGYVEEIYGEFAAIDRALALLQTGDVCLILIDQVDAALAYLAERVAAQTVLVD